MRKNIKLNKQIIKALSIGISASMMLQPMTAFANDAPESEGTPTSGEPTVQENVEETVKADSEAIAAAKAVDAKVDEAKEIVDGAKGYIVIPEASEAETEETQQVVTESSDAPSEEQSEEQNEVVYEKETRANDEIDGLLDETKTELQNVDTTLEGYESKLETAETAYDNIKLGDTALNVDEVSNNNDVNTAIIAMETAEGKISTLTAAATDEKATQAANDKNDVVTRADATYGSQAEADASKATALNEVLDAESIASAASTALTEATTAVNDATTAMSTAETELNSAKANKILAENAYKAAQDEYISILDSYGFEVTVDEETGEFIGFTPKLVDGEVSGIEVEKSEDGTITVTPGSYDGDIADAIEKARLALEKAADAKATAESEYTTAETNKETAEGQLTAAEAALEAAQAKAALLANVKAAQDAEIEAQNAYVKEANKGWFANDSKLDQLKKDRNAADLTLAKWLVEYQLLFNENITGAVVTVENGKIKATYGEGEEAVTRFFNYDVEKDDFNRDITHERKDENGNTVADPSAHWLVVNEEVVKEEEFEDTRRVDCYRDWDSDDVCDDAVAGKELTFVSGDWYKGYGYLEKYSYTTSEEVDKTYTVYEEVVSTSVTYKDGNTVIDASRVRYHSNPWGGYYYYYKSNWDAYYDNRTVVTRTETKTYGYYYYDSNRNKVTINKEDVRTVSGMYGTRFYYDTTETEEVTHYVYKSQKDETFTNTRTVTKDQESLKEWAYYTADKSTGESEAQATVTSLNETINAFTQYQNAKLIAEQKQKDVEDAYKAVLEAAKALENLKSASLINKVAATNLNTLDQSYTEAKATYETAKANYETAKANAEQAAADAVAAREAYENGAFRVVVPTSNQPTNENPSNENPAQEQQQNPTTQNQNPAGDEDQEEEDQEEEQQEEEQQEEEQQEEEQQEEQQQEEQQDIADENTALAANIDEEDTPLAALPDAKEMSWWWLLIVLALGTTGAELYRRHMVKKAKNNKN